MNEPTLTEETPAPAPADPPERGPRHPVSAALLILAAVIDGRAKALLAEIAEGTYAFNTPGGYTLMVEPVEFSGIRMAIVVAVWLPNDVMVELNFSEDALDDVLLPLIDLGIVH